MNDLKESTARAKRLRWDYAWKKTNTTNYFGRRGRGNNGTLDRQFHESRYILMYLQEYFSFGHTHNLLIPHLFAHQLVIKPHIGTEKS